MRTSVNLSIIILALAAWAVARPLGFDDLVAEADTTESLGK
jgi:hypothetical protein